MSQIPEREPCESTIIRFFNDLRDCEERLIPQKSYKTLRVVGRNVGKGLDHKIIVRVPAYLHLNEATKSSMEL